MTPVAARQRVIPFGAWMTATVIFLVGFIVLNSLAMWVHDVPAPLRYIGPIVVPFILAGYALLVGYVYGDARRRGMRYLMWTLLAIFLTNGIGIILYFILREPLAIYCSRCGGAVQHSHAFCPHCGAAVQPACQSCHRILQPGWTHCAWCGRQL